MFYGVLVDVYILCSGEGRGDEILVEDSFFGRGKETVVFVWLYLNEFSMFFCCNSCKRCVTLIIKSI